MILRTRLESLIDEMIEGQILLEEARDEFEKIYILKALERHKNNFTKTAVALGIHRNTLAKRVACYQEPPKSPKPLLPRYKKVRKI